MRKSLEWAYAVLEVKPSATPDEIRSAYRALAKKWHPDRFQGDAHLRARGEARVREVNEAYRIAKGAPRRAAIPRPPSSPPRPPSPPPRPPVDSAVWSAPAGAARPALTRREVLVA